MSGGDHHGSGMPSTLAALNSITAMDAAHRQHCRASDDWSREACRVLLKASCVFSRGHEAVGIVALIGPVGEPVHPVGCEQAEGIPALSAPALCNAAALQHDVVDLLAIKATAHGKAGLTGADNDCGYVMHCLAPRTHAPAAAMGRRMVCADQVSMPMETGTPEVRMSNTAERAR